MGARYALSIILNAHLPYVREFPAVSQREADMLYDPQLFPDSHRDTDSQAALVEQTEPAEQTSQRSVPSENAATSENALSFDQMITDLSSAEMAVSEEMEWEENPPEEINLTPGTVEESWFFEAVSETYIPLLMLFDRLEADHVPFRLGISLSPVLAQMMSDDYLQKKYLAHLEHQIEFGKREIERLGGRPRQCALAKRRYDRAIDQRTAFVTRYEANIFKALESYQQKRKIEFLATPATPAFLPFFSPYPEAIQAQMETAVSFNRYTLGINPQGFWMPEMGWSKELDPFLRSYGFNYTVADGHGFVFGNPPPSRGTFYPVRTPQGVSILPRDFCACAEITSLRKEGPYMDTGRDVGYELSLDEIAHFVAQNGARFQTGYKYWCADGSDYNPDSASAAARESARIFLENCRDRLESAIQHMPELPISLCAFNADNFGRHWHEGTQFLENLFRFAADYRDLQFMTPSEYLYLQPISSLEVSLPEYSSWGDNGYAETWLDSSNDWAYRHLNRSIDRMVELADRFSKNSSLKERALNQAAREILLAMASDWPSFLYRQECTVYARRQLEDALRNFTTIYEALGTNYISTEWLTSLERRHDIFPHINYRVFKRKN
jgi:1,4-alpha-glucan branching enzyme